MPRMASDVMVMETLMTARNVPMALATFLSLSLIRTTPVTANRKPEKNERGMEVFISHLHEFKPRSRRIRMDGKKCPFRKSIRLMIRKAAMQAREIQGVSHPLPPLRARHRARLVTLVAVISELANKNIPA